MIPIKRPVKRTQDVLYVRSPESNTPSMWSSEISHKKGLCLDPKPTPLKKQVLLSASDEVALLEAIATYPGQKASFYAKQINRPYQWTIRTLSDYRVDGVLESFPSDKRSLGWRLT